MKVSVIRSRDLMSTNVDIVQCSYAMSLLYLAALLSARLSIVLLLRVTSPSTNHQRLCLVIGCFMTTWTVACAFVSAFQCKTPMTWKFAQNKCIDRVSCCQRRRRALKADRKGWTLVLHWCSECSHRSGTHMPTCVHGAWAKYEEKQEMDSCRLLWRSHSVSSALSHCSSHR